MPLPYLKEYEQSISVVVSISLQPIQSAEFRKIKHFIN
jgi:hypothetical protein